MSTPIDPAFGRVPDSRLGTRQGSEELLRWGSKPAASVPGARWFEQFHYDPATLSNGLGTDRQWYAFRYTSCLLRGFCDADVVREALRDEGAVPVVAKRHGRAAPEAMATLWFNVIADSVCGTYHEVVLSFDVALGTREPTVFQERRAGQATWDLQYANFGPSVCDAQFLHSLWINSPLSITWGREMQAFPKHPKPVVSRLDDRPDAFQFDLQWDGNNVMRGTAGKRFGMGPFVTEGLGLVGAFGVGPVVRFLGSPSFDIPILMPKRTAEQNGVGRRYLGHLWKGLDPFAVQVWPWGDGDVLELGEVTAPTGCEEHNGHALLRRAHFEPVSVTYLPSAAALVEAA